MLQDGWQKGPRDMGMGGRDRDFMRGTGVEMGLMGGWRGGEYFQGRLEGNDVRSGKGSRRGYLGWGTQQNPNLCDGE